MAVESSSNIPLPEVARELNSLKAKKKLVDQEGESKPPKIVKAKKGPAIPKVTEIQCLILVNKPVIVQSQPIPYEHVTRSKVLDVLSSQAAETMKSNVAEVLRS
nr:hypothetical protein Iba_chr13dCG4890 [Ipomoea batatas]